MNLALRPLVLPLAVLAAAALTACGSSSKDTAAGQQSTATTSMASSSTPIPTPTPTPGLSKAEFVAKMDAVCDGVLTQLDRLPDPKDQQDLTGVVADLQGVLDLYPPYITKAEALVGQTADKAALTRNWLTLEKSDFAASEPAFKKFIADAKAGNRTAMAADARALDTLPDHSKSISAFMSGYGMKRCAKLQDS